MDSSSKTMDLEHRHGIDNYFVNFFTRTMMRTENSNAAIVLGMTFVVLAAVTIVIRTLKTQRSACRSASSRLCKKMRSTKTMSWEIIDESSMEENFGLPCLPKYESTTMIYEKTLSELHYASNKCYMEKYAVRCVQLVNYCPLLINVKCGTTGLTPFHRVCFHGHADLIKFMLSKGADPHLTFHKGENVISLAVFYYVKKSGNVGRSDLHCLDILQRAGCKLNESSIWYDMLLKKAVQGGKGGLVDWLLTNRSMPKSNRFRRNLSHLNFTLNE